ncbi:MAG: CPBP family intramembrane metalloprotease [Bacteroidetes bacterium]|nr:CPBP family intramembrane metalloprotease [Bacteroidota bacterium]
MEEKKNREPAIKSGWARAILMILSYLVASIIIQGIAGVIIAVVTKTNMMELQSVLQDPNNLGIMFSMQFVGLLIAFGVIYIYRKFIDRKTIFSLGFEVKNKTMDMIMGMVVGFGLMLIGFLALKFTNHLEVTDIQYSSKVVFGGFFFFILVAIAEEIIFRGYVLTNFMDSFKNKYLALFLSSLLFAIFHGLNPNLSLVGFINLVVAGLALGITYIHTKNLWFPIFLHLSWNYFQGPIFGFEVSGLNFNSVIHQEVVGSDLITGGNFGFEGSILITVLLIGMIVVTDRLLAKK